MARQANRFQRGSGCYRCEICGRNTRSTGRGDNEWNRSCAECFDLAGIENHISDNEVPNPEYIIEAKRLYREILKKGGKPSFDYMDLIGEVE